VSVAFCDRCGHGPIDTDFDAEAVDPDRFARYPIKCESCRERIAIQAESNTQGETKR